MLKKLVLLAAAAMTALCLLPQSLSAQGKKDSVVMAMTLEPPGLDPTSGAAAAVAEVTLYNVYETLTKVREDGSVVPLLAESFETAPDLKTYTFKLRKGVTFQNGEPFNAEAIHLTKVLIRFISDPSAQVASLLSGDVDAFPRVAAARSLAQFKADPRFAVQIGGSRAKTIVAINNKKKPLDDVRVRRAILAAIDRKAMIEGAADGFGVPIGSFYTPGSLGYIDTTDVNPFDVEKAKKLLAEAGVTTPLEVSLKLPPPAYARQGGEVLAAQLAKIGITAKIENVEWAQWLSSVFNGPHNYDLTIVSHVEPFDLVKYTEDNYYIGYKSEAFNALYKSITEAANDADRAKLLGDAQHMLATDAVAGFLYQPQLITIANKKLKGVWGQVPQFANDFSDWAWE